MSATQVRDGADWRSLLVHTRTSANSINVAAHQNKLRSPNSAPIIPPVTGPTALARPNDEKVSPYAPPRVLRGVFCAANGVGRRHHTGGEQPGHESADEQDSQVGGERLCEVRNRRSRCAETEHGSRTEAVGGPTDDRCRHQGRHHQSRKHQSCRGPDVVLVHSVQVGDEQREEPGSTMEIPTR